MANPRGAVRKEPFETKGPPARAGDALSRARRSVPAQAVAGAHLQGIWAASRCLGGPTPVLRSQHSAGLLRWPAAISARQTPPAEARPRRALTPGPVSPPPVPRGVDPHGSLLHLDSCGEVTVPACGRKVRLSRWRASPQGHTADTAYRVHTVGTASDHGHDVRVHTAARRATASTADRVHRVTRSPRRKSITRRARRKGLTGPAILHPRLTVNAASYRTTVTGVPTSTLEKKISAILPGIRMHPCEAG